jgi:hypothetical protein
MAVKKNIFITVFAIIILGLATHPVLANDAAEEKAATVEKVTEATETREAAEATAETTEEAAEATAETAEKVTEATADTVEMAAEATVEEVSGQKAEPEKKEAESVH